MRLFGIGDGQRRLRDHADADRREHLLEFAELAGVAAREDELLHRAPSTARCFAMSSPMPLYARSIIASISRRLNGSPSAVPWISTRPPEPVITTFMSVPHSESSA